MRLYIGSGRRGQGSRRGGGSTQLIIDVVPGRGGMFSLEGVEGLRFLTRSRVFTDAEAAELSGA